MLHLLVVVGFFIYILYILFEKQAVGSGGYRMGYGLASSPISLTLWARQTPKSIALTGHRHHSACTAYKLERLSAGKGSHRPASTGRGIQKNDRGGYKRLLS